MASRKADPSVQLAVLVDGEPVHAVDTSAQALNDPKLAATVAQQFGHGLVQKARAAWVKGKQERHAAATAPPDHPQPDARAEREEARAFTPDAGGEDGAPADLAEMKRPQLVAMAKELGLSTQGNKAALMERIADAQAAADGGGEEE